MKSIFHNYIKAIIGQKNEKQQTQTLKQHKKDVSNFFEDLGYQKLQNFPLALAMMACFTKIPNQGIF